MLRPLLFVSSLLPSTVVTLKILTQGPLPSSDAQLTVVTGNCNHYLLSAHVAKPVATIVATSANMDRARTVHLMKEVTPGSSARRDLKRSPRFCGPR